jgi:ABC-2 type transport system permease protein
MSATTPQSHAATHRAALVQAVAGEWTKLRSLRSTTATLTAVAVTTVGTAILVAATRSLQPEDTVLAGSLGNAAVGLIAAGAFGALTVCGEYTSGTIRATFTACPRRLVVLAAKTVTVAAVVFVVAFAAAAAAFQVGTLMLAGEGYASGDPLPALVGVALVYTVVAVLGVAVGVLLRHSAAAVTAVSAVLLLPTLLGPLLGGWQRWVAGASPIAALQKLTSGSDTLPAALGSLGGWPTLGVVTGYTLATLAVSAWTLQHRDV